MQRMKTTANHFISSLGIVLLFTIASCTLTTDRELAPPIGDMVITDTGGDADVGEDDVEPDSLADVPDQVGDDGTLDIDGSPDQPPEDGADIPDVDQGVEDSGRDQGVEDGGTDAADVPEDVSDAADVDAPDTGDDADTGAPEPRCRGRIVEVYNAGGDNWDESQVCERDERCVDGACVDLPGGFEEACDEFDECVSSDLTCIEDLCVGHAPGDVGAECWGDEECFEDLLCTRRGFCSDGIVSDPCLDDFDCDAVAAPFCGPEGLCQTGVETDPCTDDLHCADGLYCADEVLQCRDGSDGDDCDATADCDDIDSICDGDPTKCAPRVKDDLCGADDECPGDDLYCANDVCQDGTEGDFCDLTDDCGDLDNICKGAPATCEPRAVDDACTGSDDECPGDDLYCANLLCQDGITGEFCDTTDDCESPDEDCTGVPATCQNRAKGEPCGGDDECPGVLYCSNSICQDGAHEDFCDETSDCVEDDDICRGGPGQCLNRIEPEACAGDEECPVEDGLYCASNEGKCRDGSHGDECDVPADCDVIDDTCKDAPLVCNTRVFGDPCVEDDAECPGDLYCANLLCQDGTSGQFCDTTTDCDEDDDICKGDTPVCQDREELDLCAGDIECPTGLYCASDDGECRDGSHEDPCDVPADCDVHEDTCKGAPSICDTRAANDECSADSTECPGDLYCASLVCQNGATGDYCNTTDDCDSPDDVCKGDKKTCQSVAEGTPCASDEECPGVLYCSNDHCYDGTLNDYCDVQDDCSVIDLICKGGGAPQCVKRELDDPCSGNDDECPDEAGLLCAGGFCQDGSTGQLCDTIDDCVETYDVCDDGTDRCRNRALGEDCSDDTQCNADAGVYCASSEGKCRAGAIDDRCDFDSDCALITYICKGGPAVCLVRVLDDSCILDDHCPGDWYCANAMCQDGSTGEYCDTTDDCTEDYDVCDDDTDMCRTRIEEDACSDDIHCWIDNGLYCASSVSECRDGSHLDRCDNEDDCDVTEDDCKDSPSKCDTREVGDSCTGFDVDCPGDMYCLDLICYDGSTGHGCRTTDDCKETYDVCDGTTSECRNRGELDDCDGDTECPTGWYCPTSVDQCRDGSTGDECDDTDDCDEPDDICKDENEDGVWNCVDRALGDVCSEDTECPGALHCSNEQCAPDGFAFIPAATFWMGSPDGTCPEGYLGDCTSELERAGEETLHEVTITRDMYLHEAEVTQGQWLDRFPSNNPSEFDECGLNCPVESVNWAEALEYANALSAAEGLPECFFLTGCNSNPVGGGRQCTGVQVNAAEGNPYNCVGYRLPTEAEWEHAYRAGTTTAFYNGGITNTGKSPLDDNLDDIGWYGGNSGVSYANGFDCSGWAGASTCGTHEVSVPLIGKDPNANGLYDMSGNVREWVWDWYESGYYTTSPTHDPLGGRSEYRAHRGGSWFHDAASSRGANRNGQAYGDGNFTIGFRPARTYWPEHCLNDSKDGDETDVNCGGSCASCLPGIPGGVDASDGTDETKVVVTWNAAYGATSYRVYRDDVEIAAGVTGTSNDDGGADASVPSADGLELTATQGDHGDKVVLEWSGPTSAPPVGATHTYTVVAENTAGVGPASESDDGYRASSAITGFDLTVADGTTVTLAADATSHDDTTADAGTVTIGTATASDGTVPCGSRLEVDYTAFAGPMESYQITAHNLYESSSAVSATGYRGDPDVFIQWQRTSGEDDVADDYDDITGGMGKYFDDEGAPIDGAGRYYRAHLTWGGDQGGLSNTVAGSRRIQRVFPDDGLAGDRFGYSVAQSGEWAIIGAYEAGDDDTGVAYVYRFDGATTWVQTAELVGTTVGSNDQFGYDVAVDGEWAVVGAPEKGSDGTAYFFHYDTSGETPQWVEYAVLSDSDRGRFGASVAISGETIVVGAPDDDDGPNSSGAAFVFWLDEGQWTLRNQIKAATPQESSNFGNSVAVGGDGDGEGDVIIVGAFKEDEGGYPSGVAYVFRYKVVDTEWQQSQRLTPGIPADALWFGSDVAVDGETIVIGSQRDSSDAGAAYVFRWESGYVQRHQLTHTGYRYFGMTVGVAGDLTLIGGQPSDGGSNNQADLYERDSTPSWNNTADLLHPADRSGTTSTQDVSLSSEWAVVGIPFGDDDERGANAGSAVFYCVGDPGSIVSRLDGDRCGADDDCLSGNCANDYCAPAAYAYIPAGRFTMGSPPEEPGYDVDQEQHDVTLTRPFYLAKTEVTQAQWLEHVAVNPSHFSECGSTCPVDRPNWWEAAAYLNALSVAEGFDPCYALDGCDDAAIGEDMDCTDVRVLAPDGNPYLCEGYRFPTEAEWEYAYRAGTTTALHSGDIENTGFEPVDPNLDAIGWYGGNSSGTTGSDENCSDWYDGATFCGTHPAAEKLPNAWSLYDMSGNVREHVWDWYQADYYETSPVEDPLGGTGTKRVLRGGSWSTQSQYTRAARRANKLPGWQGDRGGFRPARTMFRAHCYDDITNGDETEVDCGGSCAPCIAGAECNAAIFEPSDVCQITLTETTGVARTNEPVILTGAELAASCSGDILTATVSGIRIYDDSCMSIDRQVDDLDADNRVDADEEIIFLANVEAWEGRTYALYYSDTYNADPGHGTIRFYEEDFDSYGDNTDPPGWDETLTDVYHWWKVIGGQYVGCAYNNSSYSTETYLNPTGAGWTDYVFDFDVTAMKPGVGCSVDANAFVSSIRYEDTDTLLHDRLNRSPQIYSHFRGMPESTPVPYTIVSSGLESYPTFTNPGFADNQPIHVTMQASGDEFSIVMDQPSTVVHLEATMTGMRTSAGPIGFGIEEANVYIDNIKVYRVGTNHYDTAVEVVIE